ncbi:MAG: YHS domain-containing protein [bacterium]|nr:YHS domain-containing protein [bacterium]
MFRSPGIRRARLGALLAALTLTAFAGLPGSALALDPINATFFGDVAIEGTDPVAYFTEGRPVEGTKAHSLEYMGATWRFASAENKAAFEADPDKYAPQYGGYCAWAVSQGYTAGIDPDAWTIVEGKLYLNYDESVMKSWLADRDALIDRADANWPGLRDE